MLFFTSGRAPALRRARGNPGPWFSAAPSKDADAAMEDAGAALRHAGDDIAEAARQIGAAASRQVRANAAAAGEDIGDAARHMAAAASRQALRNAGAARREAEHQVRRTAAAARKEAQNQIRRNAAAARAEAKREIRHNVRAVHANASAVADDLLPAGRDAVRKSVDRVVPGRRNRSRQSPLFRLLAVLAVTALALLGVQRLMLRRSNRLMGRRDWGRDPEGSSMTGAADASRPSDLTPGAATEPATFDRDAGIRAATEGMEPIESEVQGSSSAEITDGA